MGAGKSINREPAIFDTYTTAGYYISRGASASVFGPMPYRGMQLAIKQALFADGKVNDEFKKDLEMKKDIWTSLKHKNLMRIHLVDLTRLPIVMIIVMEYAAGGSLNKTLNSLGSENNLPINVVTNWAKQIAEGMLYLHEKNIVHRDLKSSNILLMKPFVIHDPDKMITLKIADFDEVKKHDHATTMSFVGTCAYMAPEVLKEERFTKASDVWSFGVVIWEMLSGDIPHKGLKQSTIMYKSMNGELNNLSLGQSFPEDYKRLLHGCWKSTCKKRISFRDIYSNLRRMDNSQLGNSDVNGKQSRSTLSMKSTSKNPDGSGNTFNAADLHNARSPAEQLHETEAEDVESDDDNTTGYLSNGSETSEYLSFVSSTEELMRGNQDVSRHSETDEDDEGIQGTSINSHSGNDEWVIQNVCEKDDTQSIMLSQLHLAAKHGNMEAIKSLLILSANINVLDRRHNTPLHYASLNGHTNVVDVLIRKNANVNSRNARGETPLHLASEYGHIPIAQLLLKNNADVLVSDQSNNTPIDIATKCGHDELVHLLISSIEFSHKETSSLHHTAKCGNAMDVQQILLNWDANPDARNSLGDTPLHLAFENGDLEVAEVLLRNNADVNIRNASGKTPLHIAAEMGYAKTVRALIDYEGEINAIDRNGNTALHLAASKGHIAVVRVLLNQTAEMDAQTHSQLAVDQVPADEFDLSQYSFKSNADFGHNSQPNTAEGGTVETAVNLASHSFKSKIAFKGQIEPPRLAVNRGYSEIGKNLICNAANANAHNSDKMTPLHLACQNGHTSIAEILLNNHTTVDAAKQSDETPFYLAAENGHAEVTDLLLHRGVCDFVLTDRKETPLHIAVKNGHTKVVEVILKHSCGISEKLAKDRNTFQELTKRGVMPVEILKSDYRRVSAEIVWTESHTPLVVKRDRDGFSPLVCAAFTNDPKMVQLLLSVDECFYSETDIANSFRSITAGIKYITHEALSDAKKHRVHLIKLVQFLSNSCKFNINYLDEHLNSFLHDAMRHEYEMSVDDCLAQESDRLRLQIQIDVIQLLLEKGIYFNMKNSDGETPLMIASESGFCEAIKTLFDWKEKSGLKIDIDARDRYGATALIKAVQSRHVSVMQLLLKHGASVNLYDYSGFTPLHAVFYDPSGKWLDVHILDKQLCIQKFNSKKYLQIDHKDSFTREEDTVDRNTAIYQLWEILGHDETTTRIKEEIVNLLLDDVEIDVNARDIRGNTPFDLAMKSSKPISSATFEALKNRGAILNLPDRLKEAPIAEPMVDERGRNPLHLLIISRISHDVNAHNLTYPIKQYVERFDSVVREILQKRDTFRALAAATDNKGRTPLHYAVMPLATFYSCTQIRNLVEALLKLDSKLNAADMYGKTPLHYAESDDCYKLLVKHGFSENIRNNMGHTPKELKRLRKSLTDIEDIAKKWPIGKNELYVSIDVARVLKPNHVTDLSKQKMAETIRIYSQSPRPQESSEQAIWKVWTENKFTHLNRRLRRQLNPLINRFIERLADGIKEKDWRFECQPILVGSADEETKIVISGDFNYNFKLTNFTQLCKPFPHPLGPKGYFELRKKANEDTESWSGEEFVSFFNSDQCLLTNEVNSTFQIILEEVLSDNNIWRDEHLFECYSIDRDCSISIEKPAGLCKTLLLRMIHPIFKYGEDEFLLVNITIGIVACVHVEDWWPEDLLPFDISPAMKTDGCTFVFDRPRFDLSKTHDADYPFSETFIRISFAPVESRIIKEGSFIMKAAYIVCKLILYRERKITYQLKTSLLFCMEALITQYGSETRNEVEITQKDLAFWVERIMFCFVEFSRNRVFPCYLMPSFQQKVAETDDNEIFTKTNQKEVMKGSIRYSVVYDIYLDLCPDDAAIEIPIFENDDQVSCTRQYFNACRYQSWERFDRKEFIRKLSSRSLSSSTQF